MRRNITVEFSVVFVGSRHDTKEVTHLHG